MNIGDPSQKFGALLVSQVIGQNSRQIAGVGDRPTACGREMHIHVALTIGLSSAFKAPI